MKRYAIAASAALFALVGFTAASAMPVAKSAAVQIDTRSDIQNVQQRQRVQQRQMQRRGPGVRQRVRPNRPGVRNRVIQRNRAIQRQRMQRQRFAPGQRLRAAPPGYRRYGARPSNWRSRGCIAVGPIWFCP